MRRWRHRHSARAYTYYGRGAKAVIVICSTCGHFMGHRGIERTSWATSLWGPAPTEAQLRGSSR